MSDDDDKILRPISTCLPTIIGVAPKSVQAYMIATKFAVKIGGRWFTSHAKVRAFLAHADEHGLSLYVEEKSTVWSSHAKAEVEKALEEIRQRKLREAETKRRAKWVTQREKNRKRRQEEELERRRRREERRRRREEKD